jgi:hypothetical protein
MSKFKLNGVVVDSVAVTMTFQYPLAFRKFVGLDVIVCGVNDSPVPMVALRYPSPLFGNCPAPQL